MCIKAHINISIQFPQRFCHFTLHPVSYLAFFFTYYIFQTYFHFSMLRCTLLLLGVLQCSLACICDHLFSQSLLNVQVDAGYLLLEGMLQWLSLYTFMTLQSFAGVELVGQRVHVFKLLESSQCFLLRGKALESIELNSPGIQGRTVFKGNSC